MRFQLFLVIVAIVFMPADALARDRSVLDAAIVGMSKGILLGMLATALYLCKGLIVKAKRAASNSKAKAAGVDDLSKAAANGELDAVGKLLDAGANPNATDRRGGTALMFAARNDKSDVVRLLIKRGADHSKSNANGSTALDIARRYKSTNAIPILEGASMGSGK